MASPLNRKLLTPLAAVALSTVCSEAQSSYTVAAGYVQATVPGGSFGAVAATLQNKSEHTSNASINGDHVPPVVGPPPVSGSQTITVTGAGWTEDQWIGYLVYVCDDNGGEEAFLITENTTDTLTIDTDFDLQSVDRNIPSTASISIRAAQTIGGLLGVPPDTDFTGSDKVYLWTGSGWATYFVSAGAWRKVGGGFGTFNDDLVYPDEGFFIQRNDPSDITLTFFGDVPGKAQVTTMPGPGLIFASSRYPVDTTIGQLGFETLPGWQTGSGGDLVYLWNGAGWTTYYYQGGWRKVGGGFGEFSSDIVSPDTGIFISRKGSSTAAESGNQHELPYTP